MVKTRNKTNVAAKVSANAKDIKQFLMSGEAKVDFLNNGKEMVYRIEGVEDLDIAAQGFIVDRGEVKYPKLSNDTVYIGSRKGWSSTNISFKTLICLLNGYLPKGGQVLSLKDVEFGYAPHNLVLRNKFTDEISPLSILEKVGSVVNDQDEHAVDEVVAEEYIDTVDGFKMYTKKDVVKEYVTEDGAVFPTKELADWHQENVAEAKNLAQVVLDYNGGYQLAEKVFQEKVKYNKVKPYEHFRDVMDANDGVVERDSKEVVKFNPFTIGGVPHFAHLFSNKSYTQEKADEIIDMLKHAQEVYEHLEKLSKETV